MHAAPESRLPTIVEKSRIRRTLRFRNSPVDLTLEAMFSDRSSLIREKKFHPVRPDAAGREHHSAATLTDDHTLFLLNQQREKSAKNESRGFFARLFRGA